MFKLTSYTRKLFRCCPVTDEQNMNMLIFFIYRDTTGNMSAAQNPEITSSFNLVT
jgi:hypothetical protein